MRIMMLLAVALMLTPLSALAHNDRGLTRAAVELDVRAWRFERQLAHYPGNRRLKREARQFARLSHRFLRRLNTGRRDSRTKMYRDVRRLQRAFIQLESALAGSRPRRGQRGLMRAYRGVSLAMAEVRFRAAARGYRERMGSRADHRSALRPPRGGPFRGRTVRAY